jgi:hypothetical protein
MATSDVMKMARVFTASGRCVRVMQDVARQSEMLSMQLEWEYDEDEPDLFVPGIKASVLRSALGISPLGDFNASKLAEILDAAEMLGIAGIRQRCLKGFKAALLCCCCGDCRPAEAIRPCPDATCSLV